MNFIFKSPTWARLFVSTLEQELLLNPKWRAYPYGVNYKSVAYREAATSAFEKLVESYKAQLRGENSSEIAKRIIEKYLLDENK